MNNNDNKNTNSLNEMLLAVLEKLPEQNRRVLEMKFGLCGNTPSSYETIAKELDISVEKVKELEADSLRMMRHPMN